MFNRSVATLELRTVLAFIYPDVEKIASEVKDMEKLVDLFITIFSDGGTHQVVKAVSGIKHPSFLEVDDELLDAAWSLAEVYRGKSNNRINRNLDEPDCKTSYLTSKDIQPIIENMVYEELGQKFKIQFQAKRLKQLAIENTENAEKILLDLEQRAILFYSTKTGAGFREHVSSILTELAQSNPNTAAFILNNQGLRRILLSAGPVNSSLALESIASSHIESAILIARSPSLRKIMLSQFPIKQPLAKRVAASDSEDYLVKATEIHEKIIQSIESEIDYILSLSNDKSKLLDLLTFAINTPIIAKLDVTLDSEQILSNEAREVLNKIIAMYAPKIISSQVVKSALRAIINISHQCHEVLFTEFIKTAHDEAIRLKGIDYFKEKIIIFIQKKLLEKTLIEKTLSEMTYTTLLSSVFVPEVSTANKDELQCNSSERREVATLESKQPIDTQVNMQTQSYLQTKERIEVDEDETESLSTFEVVSNNNSGDFVFEPIDDEWAAESVGSGPNVDTPLLDLEDKISQVNLDNSNDSDMESEDEIEYINSRKIKM